MPEFFNRQTRNNRPLSSAKQEKVAQSEAKGPFIGVVESTVDYQKQGSFRVSLFSSFETDRETSLGQSSVRMLYPFYSLKDYRNAGDDPQRFGDSQQAYGMVFPAPQIGTKGLVICPNNDVSQGYWIGYFIEPGMAHAVPDYAISTAITADNQTFNSYSSPNGLPAGEFNKKQQQGQIALGDERRPIHPFANILKAQGLLVDTVRGTTTSSFTRDPSNRIFGINTPGAVSQDTFDKKLVGPNKIPLKVTNLGGHVFVMDDGDEQGLNNLVRLRSSKGHQILLHDTDDLIYIGNAKGTAWVELTADGKIDIFADDSISVHTKNDFNFVADRDINLEAKRNVNIKATERMQLENKFLRSITGANATVEVRGEIDLRATNTNVEINDLSINAHNIRTLAKHNTYLKTENFDVSAVSTIRLSATENIDLKANSPQSFANTHVPGHVYQLGMRVIAPDEDGVLTIYECIGRNVKYPERIVIDPPNVDFWTVVPWAESLTVTAEGLPRYDVRLTSDGPQTGQIHVKTNGQIYVQTLEDINVKTQADMHFTTPSTVYVDGTSAVHLNLPGPGAVDATTSMSAQTLIPQPGRPTQDLPLWPNPDTSQTAQWEKFNWYQVPDTYDIVKRKPVHEPWRDHENVAKEKSNKANTDRENG